MTNKFQQLVDSILENNTVASSLGGNALVTDPNIQAAMALTGGTEPDKKKKKKKRFPLIRRNIKPTL